MLHRELGEFFVTGVLAPDLLEAEDALGRAVLLRVGGDDPARLAAEHGALADADPPLLGPHSALLQADGLPFYAQPRPDGGPLRATRLAAPEALRAAQDALRGLAALEAAGLGRRVLEEAALWRRVDGSVVLVDPGKPGAETGFAALPARLRARLERTHGAKLRGARDAEQLALLAGGSRGRKRWRWLGVALVLLAALGFYVGSGEDPGAPAAPLVRVELADGSSQTGYLLAVSPDEGRLLLRLEDGSLAIWDLPRVRGWTHVEPE